MAKSAKCSDTQYDAPGRGESLVGARFSAVWNTANSEISDSDTLVGAVFGVIGEEWEETLFDKRLPISLENEIVRTIAAIY